MHVARQIPNTDEHLVVSGPYIQLLGYDSAKGLWRASVMILTPPSKLTVLPAEPVLTFYDGGTTALSNLPRDRNTDTGVQWQFPSCTGAVLRK